MDEKSLLAFKEYEELKLKIRALEDRCAKIQPLIMPYVPEDKEIMGEKGYFYIQKRAKWKYSPATEQQEKEVKKIKKQEEATGVAIPTYTSVLYYKSGAPDAEEKE